MKRTILKGKAHPHYESRQHLAKFFTGLFPMLVLVTPPLKSR